MRARLIFTECVKLTCRRALLLPPLQRSYYFLATIAFSQVASCGELFAIAQNLIASVR